MRGRKLVFTVAAATLVFGIKATAPGASPDAGTIQDDSDGLTSCALYGTTLLGGAGCGVVFKLDQTGNETVLYTFTCGADGSNPASGVTHHTDGNLYGATYGGGADGFGVVYQLDSTGRETVLHSFTGGADGAHPSGAVFDPAGNLHGTASHGGISNFGVVFKLEPGDRYHITHSFTGTDGSYPSGVVRDSAGNFYGVTFNGGAHDAGVVYKLDSTGRETVLYSFTGGADGANPHLGVVLDSAGNLYGTTAYGGAFGFGVVYKVDSAGKETVLHSFTGGTDGATPLGGVILDSNGNLYGTTGGHGAHWGVVYELDSTGRETVLHSFTGGVDSGTPMGSVILDSAGNLFGTTFGGRSDNGVVYKLGPARKKLTVLHAFTGGADGAHPPSGVILLRQ
jgi:uncharacterized repeat protein (TIGR03803 family)